MKTKLGFILVGISMTLGCTHTVRFYPVQGSLSAQTPSPVLVGKVTGVITPKDISVVLSDGEVCKGHWVIVHPVQVPKGATTATAATTNGMPSAWDTVYGPGFYVSHVLGARLYAQAAVSGDKGTVLNVEMYRPMNEPEAIPGDSVKGVAKDNKGNIYKLVLQ
ncbi:MAG: hypothetical protein LAO23_19975 [Acidobacteriia bacterium]|nr:hypothetical protein [Terriglobia bacterium]